MLSISGVRTTSSTNTGAIAGGVVGGVVGLAILAGLIYFFYFRREEETQDEQGDVDLMTGEETPTRTSPANGAGFYRPVPPEPGVSAGRASSDVLGAYTEASTPPPSVPGALLDGSSRDRRVSQQSAGEMTQTSSDPASTSLMTPRTNLRDRKAPPSAMRAVNIVQHEDAGEVRSEEQVVELPPTYASVRKPGNDGEEPPPPT